MKSQHRAGQFNLKGKLYKLLYCKCCEVINFKQKFLKKEHIKEIKTQSNTEMAHSHSEAD